MPNQPEWAVFGLGAVGGYLTGRLERGRPQSDIGSLTVVARPRVAGAIADHGLIVREDGGTTVAHPRVLSAPEEVGEQDVTLLTVRTMDVEPAVPELRRLLGERGILIAFQNGVGTEETLADALGRERVLVGTLTVSVGMEEPGIITRYSRGGGVALSSMDGAPVPPHIVQAFAATGLPTATLRDYRSLRWSKLLLNMLGAATTAILDMDLAEVMSCAALFRAEQLSVREAGRVMDRLGVETVNLPGYPVRPLRLLMRLPRPLAQRLLAPRITGARRGRSPSMRADMARNRSEVDTFHGAVARLGAARGIPTPVNGALADLTLDLAAHPEKRSPWHHHPEELIRHLRSHGVRI